MATARKAAAGRKAVATKSTAKESTAGRNAATKASAAKKAAAKPAASRSATRSSNDRETATTAPASKTPAKKTTAKKATAKAPAKKATAKKATAKKATAKAPTKKAAATKATVKKAAPEPATKKAPAGKAARRTGRDTGSHVPAGDLVVRQDEDPWTEAELEEIRTELTAEIDRHEEQARAVSADLAEMRLTAEAGGDAADVGTSNFERDQELTLAAYAQDAVHQTRLALEKMDQGTYGQCDNCGQPIGKGRLQVYPRATLCLTCKQREERR